jgi:type I pantothenate kinase
VTEEAWPGYRVFERDEWARLRESTPLTLAAQDLASLRGLNDRLDLDELQTDIFIQLVCPLHWQDTGEVGDAVFVKLFG